MLNAMERNGGPRELVMAGQIDVAWGWCGAERVSGLGALQHAHFGRCAAISFLAARRQPRAAAVSWVEPLGAPEATRPHQCACNLPLV